MFSGVYETLYALAQQNQNATGARERFDVDLPADAVREVRAAPQLTAYDRPAKPLVAALLGFVEPDSEGGECD
ncbi:hypothetical protein [Burkholderia vietnamiensis]|uniref:hypothetical protein n=1 Tax=Burkholderia vietnamiensis TaxID=60552 RepID=UPI00352F701E